MRRRFAVACCVLLSLCAARSARAEEMTWIQGGHYSITDHGDSYRFDVVNPFQNNLVSVVGFAISVAGISQMSCYICDPGDTFAIGRHTLNPMPGAAGAADLGTAGITMSGVQTTPFRLEGWLTFLADSITLPAWSAADLSFEVPFRARVSFNAFDLNNPGGGLFARWNGAGTAHVTFSPTADGHWSNAAGELLRFDFSSTRPVPEPASMFLIATGLAGIAGAARRKMRRQDGGV